MRGHEAVGTGVLVALAFVGFAAGACRTAAVDDRLDDATARALLAQAQAGARPGATTCQFLARDHRDAQVAVLAAARPEQLVSAAMDDAGVAKLSLDAGNHQVLLLTLYTERGRCREFFADGPQRR